MGFSLPVFNLVVNDQYLSDDAGVGAVPYPGNVSLGPRVPQTGVLADSSNLDYLPQWLLTPSVSEVGTLTTSPNNPDAIEVPAGSGRYYLAVDGAYVGLGFPNEHLAIVLVPLTDALVAYLIAPIPDGLGLTVGAYPSFPAFLGG